MWKQVRASPAGVTADSLADATNIPLDVAVRFLHALADRGLIYHDLDDLTCRAKPVLSQPGDDLSPLRTYWYNGLSSVALEITNCCNLACSHCYLNIRKPDEALGTQTPLTALEWEQLIARLYEVGVIEIKLTGGEPLVHPDFSKILAIINKFSFAVSINTNALLIDKNVVEMLLKTPLLGIAVSLYSHVPEVHDAITGVAGSHAKTFQNMLTASSFGLPVVMNCPIMIYNQDYITDTIKFAHSHGFRIICDAQIRNGEKDREHLSVTSSSRIAEWISNSRRINGDQRSRRHQREELLSEPICEAGSSALTITENGDVYPCMVLRKRVGNIKDKDIVDIFENSQFLRGMREFRLSKRKACRQCPNISYCQYCMAGSFEKTGRIDEPVKDVCVQAKLRRMLAAKGVQNASQRAAYGNENRGTL